MVQMFTLVRVAAAGAVVTVGTGLYLQQLLQQRVRNSEVYKQLTNHVQHNKGAVALLGEPLIFGSVDISNNENYCYSDKVHLQIPINGSKNKGVLEFSAEKSSEDSVWKFNSIELDIKDEQGGRLNILKQHSK